MGSPTKPGRSRTPRGWRNCRIPVCSPRLGSRCGRPRRSPPAGSRRDPPRSASCPSPEQTLPPTPIRFLESRSRVVRAAARAAFHGAATCRWRRNISGDEPEQRLVADAASTFVETQDVVVPWQAGERDEAPARRRLIAHDVLISHLQEDIRGQDRFQMSRETTIGQIIVRQLDLIIREGEYAVEKRFVDRPAGVPMDGAGSRRFSLVEARRERSAIQVILKCLVDESPVRQCPEGRNGLDVTFAADRRRRVRLVWPGSLGGARPKGVGFADGCRRAVAGDDLLDQRRSGARQACDEIGSAPEKPGGREASQVRLWARMIRSISAISAALSWLIELRCRSQPALMLLNARSCSSRSSYSLPKANWSMILPWRGRPSSRSSASIAAM